MPFIHFKLLLLTWNYVELLGNCLDIIKVLEIIWNYLTLLGIA